MLLCEGALRLLGVVYLHRADRGVRGADELGPEGKTFVCLGDSNTFGLWVDAADSYPARLQDLLDEHVAGGPHRVVNLGVPGLNSRQVRKRLTAALEEFEPDGIFVLVGFNDRWAWKPEADNDDFFVDPPWYENLRLVKVLRLATGGGEGESERIIAARQQGLRGGIDRTGREFLFQPADYNAPRELDSVRQTLVKSLRAMCANAEEATTPIHLLTYAGGREAYKLANRAAGGVNAERSARSIDVRAWFETQEEVPWEDVFFPDGHPRELGYELFARLVFNGLIEQGALEAGPIEPLTRDLVSRPAPPILRLRLERSALAVRRERPGRRFAMFLSHAGEGPVAKVGGAALPLVDDELFRRTKEDARLRGVIARDGGGTVSIAHLLEDPTLSGRSLIAVSVSWKSTVPTVSTTVEFQVPERRPRSRL
ncbi:MAG: GDSL-type esterase/lipase family protein [Acidobacteria bacterium]|nr:GDSL-type esterase/lipase family protein [Acidobacteriota bacterium]